MHPPSIWMFRSKKTQCLEGGVKCKVPAEKAMLVGVGLEGCKVRAAAPVRALVTDLDALHVVNVAAEAAAIQVLAVFR